MQRARSVSVVTFALSVSIPLACFPLLPGCADSPAPSADGAFTPKSIVGEPGRFPGQFDYPRGLDVWNDRLVIVDKSARIQVLDAETGNPIAWWQTPEWKLGKPTGLTVAAHPEDPDREALWVADTHYHRILVYELPGIVYDPSKRAVELDAEPVFMFGEFGREPGQFIYPTDILVLKQDPPTEGPLGHIARVYVSEYGGNDRVTAFEPDGDELAPIFEFGELGSSPGSIGEVGGVEFQRPQSLAFDPEGDEGRGSLIIADSCNHRVGTFSLDGAPLRWFGSPESAGSELVGAQTYPYSIQLLEDRTMLVCEFGAARVQQMRVETGDVLRVWGRPGREPGEFNQPWAVAVHDRTAHVLDARNHRVQSFPSPAAAMDRSRITAPGSMAIAQGGDE